MKSAIITNGIVSNIIIGAIDGSVECGDEVQIGWTYASGKFSAPAAPDPTKAELALYANQKQWMLATGGYTVTIGGQAVTFSTDERGYSLITGKAARFQQPNPPASVNWQFSDGSWVDVAAADFIAAAIAIADFMQATFDALKLVLDDINAGTITTVAEIDGYAWPASQ